MEEHESELGESLESLKERVNELNELVGKLQARINELETEKGDSSENSGDTSAAKEKITGKKEKNGGKSKKEKRAIESFSEIGDFEEFKKYMRSIGSSVTSSKKRLERIRKSEESIEEIEDLVKKTRAQARLENRKVQKITFDEDIKRNLAIASTYIEAKIKEEENLCEESRRKLEKNKALLAKILKSKKHSKHAKQVAKQVAKGVIKELNDDIKKHEKMIKSLERYRNQVSRYNERLSANERETKKDGEKLQPGVRIEKEEVSAEQEEASAEKEEASAEQEEADKHVARYDISKITFNENGATINYTDRFEHTEKTHNVSTVDLRETMEKYRLDENIVMFVDSKRDPMQALIKITIAAFTDDRPAFSLLRYRGLAGDGETSISGIPVSDFLEKSYVITTKRNENSEYENEIKDVAKKVITYDLSRMNGITGFFRRIRNDFGVTNLIMSAGKMASRMQLGTAVDDNATPTAKRQAVRTGIPTRNPVWASSWELTSAQKKIANSPVNINEGIPPQDELEEKVGSQDLSQ